MTRSTTDSLVTRRTALAGLGAGGLGLAIAASTHHASAQDADALANHPIVGVWNAMTPGGPAPGIFFPNGIALMTPQVTQAGPNGVTFVTSNPGCGSRSANAASISPACRSTPTRRAPTSAVSRSMGTPW